jgi:excinuclease UvrABC nuclease subunit
MIHTKWSRIPFVAGLESDVPKDSGIYVINRTNWVLGLLLEMAVIYVGQSVNLRRRYREHVSPWRSTNERLVSISRESGTEFWYMKVPPEHLDEVERELIRTIQPAANRLRYIGVDHDD